MKKVYLGDTLLSILDSHIPYLPYISIPPTYVPIPLYMQIPVLTHSMMDRENYYIVWGDLYNMNHY